MKKITLLYFVLISLGFVANAQNAGDYRTFGSGPWSSILIWERFDGMNWIAAPTVPNSTDGIITVRSPHIVTVNSASSGDQIIIESGGTFNIEAAFTLNDGPGDDITVNGMLNFMSGSIDGAGTVSITSAATLMLSTSSVKTTAPGIVIINNGVMTWQEGGINGSSAVINNNVFNISATALWQFNGGITNSGTINKTAGSTNIATPWSNSGTINFSGGTLTSSSIFTNTGILTFSSGAAWQNMSTFNHNAGSVITGTGSFNNSGTLSLAVDQIFPSTLILSNSGNINGPGALTINNDFVIQGMITGGNMTLNGNGDWQGGTLGRSLTINAGRTLLLSTATVKTSNSGTTLTNNGIMTWQEGGINGSGAVINNNVFNISANALWQDNGGLTNAGTINKTGGSTTIATPWSNSGTINFSGGTLTSSSIFTNTGTLTFSSGAAWQNMSTFNHNAGSVITGTGSFNNSGTLSLAVDQIFPSTLIFSNSGNINGPGALTINNDFVIQGSIIGGNMTLNGNGDWQGGTLGRSLTINAGRTLLLSTATVKTSSSGTTLTNNGIMTWQEGGINGSGAVINNNVFNISANALWQDNGGLTNAGTINKTGGSTTIATPWSNSGTINFSGGTLTSSSIFTNTGTLTFSSGAAWQNVSGFNHNAGSVITGTGSFNNSGTLSLAIDQIFPSTLIFSNSGTINGPGALTINNDFLIQGTITGGDMTLNGNGDWQGGTLGRSLTMNAGRTLLLSTANVKTSSAGTTLTNNGIMTWQEGGINGSGAVINNNVFNISANALWQFSGGLTNSGTINKTAGSTTIATPWSNSGTINFSGGTLTSSSIFTNTGTLTFSSGAAWQNVSTFNHNVGSVITGTGSFNNSGTLSLAIDQIFPSTLIFSNSNIIDGPGALTINNDFVIQGSISGGNMTLNGNGDWQGGTLGRSLTVNAGRTFLLSTANVKTSAGGTTLTNNGVMTWQEGGINGAGAVINNNILNINANALWQFNGGLTNNGILSNNSLPNFGTPVINSISGTIQGVATILFSNAFTNNGIVAPGFSPGILKVNGAQPFTPSSTLSIEINNGSGPGTGHDQLQRDGNLTLAGTLSVTETGTVPDGIYTIINLISGNITGNFSTINLPPGYTIQVNPTHVRIGKNTPLSLNLITFTAKKTNDKKVNLEWVTTDEHNVSHFEVERSMDLKTFSRLTNVDALNVSEGGYYSFTDEAPGIKNNYYRLRMVDLDASAKLSPVKFVYFNNNNEILVFPTITSDKVQILSPEEIEIQLFSMSGSLLRQKHLVGQDFIDLSNLPAGLYVLKYGVAGHTVKIMKE